MKKVFLNIIIILIASCSNFKTLNIKNASFTPYKLEISQGNEIFNDNIQNIKIGDTKDQVLNLLGYPIIQDPFHKDRWDYQYYFKDNKKRINKIFTIYFKDNKVSNLENN